MYSKEQIEAAEYYFGHNMKYYSERKRNMMVTYYHYREGWINEDTLDEILLKIYKTKK